MPDVYKLDFILLGSKLVIPIPLACWYTVVFCILSLLTGAIFLPSQELLYVLFALSFLFILDLILVKSSGVFSNSILDRFSNMWKL